MLVNRQELQRRFQEEFRRLLASGHSKESAAAMALVAIRGESTPNVSYIEPMSTEHSSSQQLHVCPGTTDTTDSSRTGGEIERATVHTVSEPPHGSTLIELSRSNGDTTIGSVCPAEATEIALETSSTIIPDGSSRNTSETSDVVIEPVSTSDTFLSHIANYAVAEDLARSHLIELVRNIFVRPLSFSTTFDCVRCQSLANAGIDPSSWRRLFENHADHESSCGIPVESPMAERCTRRTRHHYKTPPKPPNDMMEQ